MRQIINPQLELGEQDISRIELDALSRHDIPRILRGLQYIYVTPEVREQVFAILAEVLPQGDDGEGTVNPDLGRPGMAQHDQQDVSARHIVLSNSGLSGAAKPANVAFPVRQNTKSGHALKMAALPF